MGSVNSDTAIIIPVRYDSQRLPGKPLAIIRGRSMVERVWAIASQVTGVSGVYVATDDDRIEQAVLSFGGQVIRTSRSCRNGTERVYEAACSLKTKPKYVINPQGDALLTPPWVIQAAVDELQSESSDARIVTPAVRLNKAEYVKIKEAKLNGNGGGTMVVMDKHRNALYFSKYLIPHLRVELDPLPVFRHIGLYGYSMDTLTEYVELEPTPLEVSEGLEQLRALENGIPIKVVVVDYKGRSHASVDTLEDIKRAEDIIDREGELL